MSTDALIYVCPSCGEPAGERPFCGRCGLNLAQFERLPSREAWAAGLPSRAALRGKRMASWGYRTGGFLVDLALAVFAGLAVGGGLTALGASDRAVELIGFYSVPLVWVLNTTVLVGLTRGRSAGKLLAGTRIVKEDGRAVRFGVGFLRDTLCRLLYFVPLFGLVDMLMPLGEQRQSLRDKMVSTRVVREPSYRPRRWVLTPVAVLLTAGWIATIAVAGTFETTDDYDSLDKDLFVSGCTDEGRSEAGCACAYEYIKARVPYDDYASANRHEPDDWPPHVRRTIADGFTRCPE